MKVMLYALVLPDYHILSCVAWLCCTTPDNRIYIDLSGVGCIAAHPAGCCTFGNLTLSLSLSISGPAYTRRYR